MKLEELVQFHNELVQFDSNEPIAVYHKEGVGLVYRQLNKISAISCIDNYYFANPPIKLGVLMPQDCKELLNSIEVLIQDPALNSNQLNTIIGDYEIKVFKLFKGLQGPQLAYHLKFVTFTNSIISKWQLNHYNLSSKLLLKAIRNENRTRNSKGSKN